MVNIISSEKKSFYNNLLLISSIAGDPYILQKSKKYHQLCSSPIFFQELHTIVFHILMSATVET